MHLSISIEMELFFRKHTETLLVGLLGLTIFACLNCMMLQMNYETWTTLKFGAYSAFHTGWELSGFDNTTYTAIATGRPLYIMMRHPLIMYFIWPLWQLHDILQEELKMNCSIHIVAVLWTIISTVSWLLMYRIMRKIIVLPVAVSLLLCLFYYSFSHVMLATFVPDHMILSMTLLLTTIYLAAKAAKNGRQMSTWKALVLCFLATGISTTNSVKIWLIDVMGMQGKGAFRTVAWWKRFVLHGMMYLLPLGAAGGLYYYQTKTMFAEEDSHAREMDARFKQRNPEKAAEREAKYSKRIAENESKQLIDSKLFQWTDFTLPLGESIVENILGEGLQLHDEHTLQDSNGERHRPAIVNYSNWYNYLVEFVIVALLIVGMWFGRRERLMWMAMSVMAFDALLHVGFRFALIDVYIMTAHWAFVIPFAVAYIYKGVEKQKELRTILLTVVTLLTLFLWFHNLTLTYNYIVK